MCDRDKNVLTILKTFSVEELRLLVRILTIFVHLRIRDASDGCMCRFDVTKNTFEGDALGSP